MLIEFSVGNFRSFHEPVTFSMVAAPLVSVDKQLDTENVVHVDDDLTLLASSAIYGANASGKSNLLRAMSAMRGLVSQSATKLEEGEKLPLIEPFRLSTSTAGEPSFFQMVFLINGRRFRYGFEVTREKVISEWLFMMRTSKETKLFVRKKDDIQVNERSFREGRDLEKRTRSNALFLSVVAQFNGRISQAISTWFRSLNVVSGLLDNRYLGFTLNRITENRDRDAIQDLIYRLDLSIREFRVEKLAPIEEDIEEKRKGAVDGDEGNPPALRMRVETLHPKYNAQGKRVGEEGLSLITHESEGTRKLFAFAGPLVDTLKYGKRLVIDEMDARLHPLITCAIIKLFHCEESNPRGAQLIFATHDTNLLSNKIFRRDQVWFAEKDSRGATHLYSLAELKGVRNDASFENDYIKGRYGAIPFLGDLKSILGEASEAEIEEVEVENIETSASTEEVEAGMHG